MVLMMGTSRDVSLVIKTSQKEFVHFCQQMELLEKAEQTLKPAPQKDSSNQRGKSSNIMVLVVKTSIHNEKRVIVSQIRIWAM